jgi:hypothetical protein
MLGIPKDRPAEAKPLMSIVGLKMGFETKIDAVNVQDINPAE